MNPVPDTCEEVTGIDRINETAGRLLDVLVRENAAITDGNRAELKHILDEKTAVCAAYQSAFAAVVDRPDLVQAISVDLKVTLNRLTALADENARRLAAAIEANRRLLSAVAAAISEPAPSARSYGANGSLKKVGAHRYALPPPAVSLNRAF